MQPSRQLLVGAVEVQDARVRLAEVADYSVGSLHPFVARNLAAGAAAKTDGWVLPWVHRIFFNLKMWALGVYHGLRRQHL